MKIVTLKMTDKQAKQVYSLLKKEAEGLDAVLSAKMVFIAAKREDLIDKVDTYDMLKGQIIKQVGD